MFSSAVTTKWLFDNELYLVIGECGFGRACVGVMYTKTCHWIGYHDCEVAQRSRPEDAYHKDDYLCVLVHNDDYQKAIVQLDAWVTAIVNGPHRVIDGQETGLSSLVSGRPTPVKALVDA